MGKSFSQSGGPVSTRERLSKLRSLLGDHSLDALVVPTDDSHASEYVAPCDGRREFISGFSGSAGVAVVQKDSAKLFTDGRYTLQAKAQLDDNWSLFIRGVPGEPLWNEYVAQLPKEFKVGVDAATLSIADANELRNDHSVQLVPTQVNLVDQVWGEDRPSRPANEVYEHPIQYAGQSVKDKVVKLRKSLEEHKAQALVVAALDEVAWVLNLRGSDIDYNPIFFSYLLVTPQELFLFINSSQLSKEATSYLESINVQTKPYDDFLPFLALWSKGVDRVLIPDSASWAISTAATAEKSHIVPSPVSMLKAVKNEAELQGFRDCHVRDGAALTAYFAWLEQQLQSGATLSEYDAALKLEELRSKQDKFKGLSFTTISSTGPNAAIIHYSPSATECAKIDRDQIYLCDSGAQFADGTTDVTRTLHFGTPSQELKEANTLVLKSHIAIDRARFPNGTTGFQIDTLARAPLWNVGLDYAHGTGHGIGSFLNVHEGPHSISFRESANKHALQAGMTVSNEPGFYKDGHWGIRIENVVLCKELQLPNNFRSKGYLGFERVTMCPITPKLIEPSMLLPHEKAWINEYHAEVLEKLTPLLKSNELAYAYLKRECAPIA